MSGVGVWLVGGYGNIATTAMVGAKAVARGETGPIGLVTERPPVSDLALVEFDELVFGGHDIRDGDVVTDAHELAAENGMPDADTVAAVDADLAGIDERIQTGTALNCGSTVESLADIDLLESGRSVAEIIDILRSDFAAFSRENDLDTVVIVNVASSEPPVTRDRWETREALEGAIENDDRDLPASSLYAYAAIAEGYPYANFTPNTGSSLGGIRQLADERSVPHMGNDGKTGESLVKSALGPMFAGRNLRMLSWEAHNILGNTDGQVLKDDRNKAGKLESKDGILRKVLDDDFHSRVRIDYTPSLDDWKTAWDFIHFEGFLNTEMKMQFIWEGSDSALAAPLVLDLVRLLDHADEHGQGGLQPHLASFFKAPLGVDEHDLSLQFQRLYRYAREWSDGRPTVAESATNE